jgi:hypothetical protein
MNQIVVSIIFDRELVKTVEGGAATQPERLVHRRGTSRIDTR